MLKVGAKKVNAYKLNGVGVQLLLKKITFFLKTSKTERCMVPLIAVKRTIHPLITGSPKLVQYLTWMYLLSSRIFLEMLFVENEPLVLSFSHAGRR